MIHRHRKLYTAVCCIIIVVIIVHSLVSAVVESNKAETKTAAKNTQSTQSTASETESKPDYRTQIEAVDTGTSLYEVASNTPYYTEDTDGSAYFDYADGSITGKYTGRESEKYSGYIEIDYKDGEVLVEEVYVSQISGAQVVPLGVISQITESYTGQSGCGPACLYMMLRNVSDESKETESAGADESETLITSYESLLEYAEGNGYGDMGSLLSSGGGMTADSLESLALDVYGLEMLNAYSDTAKPSEILKNLIDGGKQAIVLVKHWNGEIVTESEISHFIIVTGYYESDGKTLFVYGNSYYSTDVTHGNPLMTVDATLLDESASSVFDEPNTILYIE